MNALLLENASTKPTTRYALETFGVVTAATAMYADD